MIPSVGLRAVGLPYLRRSSLAAQENHGSPKFLMSLFPHATRWRPRRSHRALAIAHPCCWLPCKKACRPPVVVLTRLNRFGEVPLPCGLRDSLSTLRLCRSFVSSFPSQPQDSVGIEWLTLALPDFRPSVTFRADFHRARDTKLRLAHSRQTHTNSPRLVPQSGPCSAIFLSAGLTNDTRNKLYPPFEPVV